jgi:hypothetical protein
VEPVGRRRSSRLSTELTQPKVPPHLLLPPPCALRREDNSPAECTEAAAPPPRMPLPHKHEEEAVGRRRSSRLSTELTQPKVPLPPLPLPPCALRREDNSPAECTEAAAPPPRMPLPHKHEEEAVGRGRSSRLSTDAARPTAPLPPLLLLPPCAPRREDTRPAECAVERRRSARLSTDPARLAVHRSCSICRDGCVGTAGAGEEEQELEEGEEATLLPCGHQFHAACIQPWLTLRSTCPLCRQVRAEP